MGISLIDHAIHKQLSNKRKTKFHLYATYQALKMVGSIATSQNGDQRRGPVPRFRIRSAIIGTYVPSTPSLGHESRLRPTQRDGLVWTRHSLVAAQGVHGINLGGPARGDVG